MDWAWIFINLVFLNKLLFGWKNEHKVKEIQSKYNYVPPVTQHYTPQIDRFVYLNTYLTGPAICIIKTTVTPMFWYPTILAVTVET